MTREKDRIQFEKGKQREFLKYAKELSGEKWNKNKTVFGLNYNTIQGYYKEFSRLSETNFEKICDIVGVKPEDMLKKFTGKRIRWNFEDSFKGKSGFGIPRINTSKPKIFFKNTSILLDATKVPFSRIDKKKRIILPKKITPKLAEETGAHLGDGFLSNKRFEYRLKGNKNDEREYYTDFIAPLLKEIYNIDVNLKEYKRSFGFELYSKAINQFKENVVGLQSGPKENIRIPKTMKTKNEKILCSLLRGYFDTDGTISFTERYGKGNYYPTVSVSSVSKQLIKDVSEILSMLGFNQKLWVDKKTSKRCPNKKYYAILNGYKNFRLYKKLIGTRQKKNLDKIKKWEERYPELV